MRSESQVGLTILAPLFEIWYHSSLMNCKCGLNSLLRCSLPRPLFGTDRNLASSGRCGFKFRTEQHFFYAAVGTAQRGDSLRYGSIPFLWAPNGLKPVRLLRIIGLYLVEKRSSLEYTKHCECRPPHARELPHRPNTTVYMRWGSVDDWCGSKRQLLRSEPRATQATTARKGCAVATFGDHSICGRRER